MIRKEIVGQFGICGEVSFTELDAGHINKTCIAETDSGEKFILQSLNRSVFRDPEAVMRNIAKIQKAAAESEDVAVPQYLDAVDGRNFVQFGGELYRMYKYMESPSGSIDDNYAAGVSFGAFIRLLGKKSIRLENTIDGFHCYRKYLAELAAAEKLSPLKKLDRSVMSRINMLGNTLDQVFTVDFPQRNIHGDAKTSNIISGTPCMVIDLDTAMKGYAAIDYGDLVRSVCTGERLDLTAVRDITQGFADGLGGCLNEDEIYSLYYGILYVTGELAVRYLTDYLREDKYFRDKTSAQCLRRADELMRQLSIFIEAGDEITDVIYKSFRKQ